MLLQRGNSLKACIKKLILPIKTKTLDKTRANIKVEVGQIHREIFITNKHFDFKYKLTKPPKTAFSTYH